MSMSISLYNVLGQQVFNWTPNGTLANGIVGGTETLDASNLNTGITSVNTFSPASGSFAAQSFSLAAGTYTISIGMSNQVTSVPEADSWAMLLAGLGLVGFAARRKLS
jgi:MYXO-CTERM domain-containing protein